MNDPGTHQNDRPGDPLEGRAVWLSEQSRLSLKLSREAGPWRYPGAGAPDRGGWLLLAAAHGSFGPREASALEILQRRQVDDPVAALRRAQQRQEMTSPSEKWHWRPGLGWTGRHSVDSVLWALEAPEELQGSRAAHLAQNLEFRPNVFTQWPTPRLRSGEEDLFSAAVRWQLQAPEQRSDPERHADWARLIAWHGGSPLPDEQTQQRANRDLALKLGRPQRGLERFRQNLPASMPRAMTAQVPDAPHPQKISLLQDELPDWQDVLPEWIQRRWQAASKKSARNTQRHRFRSPRDWWTQGPGAQADDLPEALFTEPESWNAGTYAERQGALACGPWNHRLRRPEWTGGLWYRSPKALSLVQLHWTPRGWRWRGARWTNGSWARESWPQDRE